MRVSDEGRSDNAYIGPAGGALNASFRGRHDSDPQPRPDEREQGSLVERGGERGGREREKWLSERERETAEKGRGGRERGEGEREVQSVERSSRGVALLVPSAACVNA